MTAKPSIRVTFVDRQTGNEWTELVVCLPHQGDTVFLYRAPKGALHVVAKVIHKICRDYHGIRIVLDALAR